MSFFGLFGGSKDENKNCADDDCERNQTLKDHLRKCAGYGQRPPLVESCCAEKTECPVDHLGGPPTCCKGKTPPPTCCPVPITKKVAPFVPHCDVPPTLTFKCPDSSCDQVKPQCVEKKPECTEEVVRKCCPPVTLTCAPKNENSCDTKK